MLNNQTSTSWEMSSIRYKLKVNKPEDVGKCIKERKKGRSFGKVNELHFPKFTLQVHGRIGEIFIRDHFPNS
jgi:hypothetical protein